MAVNKWKNYTDHNKFQKIEWHNLHTKFNTGLFEIIIGVLTTCHAQYT